MRQRFLCGRDDSGSAKPLRLFPDGFISHLSCIKVCVSVALPFCSVLDQAEKKIHEYMDRTLSVHECIESCGLTLLEAEAVLWWSADFSCFGLCESESIYFIYNTAVRSGSAEHLDKWKHFSFFLVCAMEKLPIVKGIVYRGESVRVLLKNQYVRGKKVCWVAFSSTTLDNGETLMMFGENGTLFKLFIDCGRDIRGLSLFPSENEVLVPPNSTFQVELTLTCNEARMLDGLATLPDNVDLVVLRQVPTEPSHSVMRTRTAATAAPISISTMRIPGASAGSQEDLDLQITSLDAASINTINEQRYSEAMKRLVQDDLGARMLFEQASEHAGAQYELGVFHRDGRGGLAQDSAEAVKWFRRSAESRNALGQNSLGLMLENGRGVAQNYVEAQNWYFASAGQGNEEAMFNLGRMHDKGLGVTQDHKAAANWFWQAAALGHAKAQYSLGLLFESGRGVVRDYAEAVDWFRRSADQKNSDALYNLGCMYESGRGLGKDVDAARNLFQRAAKQDHQIAKDRLKVLDSRKSSSCCPM